MNRFVPAFLVVLVAVSCTEATSLVVEVGSSGYRPGIDLDEVMAQVTINKTVFHTFPLTTNSGLPLFAVVPAVSHTDRVWIKITGFFNNEEVVNAGALVGFVKGETRKLRLDFLRPCQGVQCRNTKETCQPDSKTCGPLPVVEASTLPPFAGPSPGKPVVPGSDSGVALMAPDARPPGPDPRPSVADGGASDLSRPDTRIFDASSGDGGVQVPLPIDASPVDSRVPIPRPIDASPVDGRVPIPRPIDASPDAPLVLVDAPVQPCATGESQDCGCGGGAPGTRICTAGLWGACTTSCAMIGYRGRCAVGTSTCVGGQWAGCPQAFATDTCSSLDNDDNCNGTVYEGCDCLNSMPRKCSPCQQDTQTCRNGSWPACPVYEASDRQHCGPSCLSCPLKANATVSCDGTACKKECDLKLPSPCFADDGPACGSWAFESGLQTEGWSLKQSISWDGVLFAVKAAPGGSKALAIGFDSQVTGAATTFTAAGAGVQLCATDMVDMTNKRLTAQIYVEGEDLGVDAQVYWIQSQLANAVGATNSMYPETGIKWNQWFPLDVGVVSGASQAKSISFTFWLGIPKTKRWKGTIYIDQVKIQ